MLTQVLSREHGPDCRISGAILYEMVRRLTTSMVCPPTFINYGRLQNKFIYRLALHSQTITIFVQQGCFAVPYLPGPSILLTIGTGLAVCLMALIKVLSLNNPPCHRESRCTTPPYRKAIKLGVCGVTIVACLLCSVGVVWMLAAGRAPTNKAGHTSVR